MSSISLDNLAIKFQGFARLDNYDIETITADYISCGPVVLSSTFQRPVASKSILTL